MNQFSIRIAKKKESLPTESMLRKEVDSKAPDKVTDAQLEKLREEKFSINLIEKNLDEVRNGDGERKPPTSVDMLTETQLNKSKSKLHPHRDEETSKGDINQLDKNRKKTPAKDLKAEPASETPKDFRFWEATAGGDKLQIANSFTINIKTASGMWDPASILERKTKPEEDDGLDPDSDSPDQEDPELDLTDDSEKEVLDALRTKILEDQIVHGKISTTEDPLTEPVERVDVEEPKRRHSGVPKNPDGPESDRIFDDVNIGTSNESGTKIEQRALLFEPKRFSWAGDDASLIIDQALRFLNRKYPEAQLTADHLDLDTSDPEMSVIRFHLVG